MVTTQSKVKLTIYYGQQAEEEVYELWPASRLVACANDAVMSHLHETLTFYHVVQMVLLHEQARIIMAETSLNTSFMNNISHSSCSRLARSNVWTGAAVVSVTVMLVMLSIAFMVTVMISDDDNG